MSVSLQNDITESETRQSDLKVMHVVLGLEIGGLERVVVDLVSSAAPEIRPMICCLQFAGPLAQEIRSQAIPLIEINKKPGIDIRAIIRLSRLLKDNRVDIIHTHNQGVHLHGVLAARLAKTPVIIHTKHGRNLPNPRRKIRLNAWCNRQSDMVVAVSEDAREVALEIEKTPAHKVTTIVNGIDVEMYASGSLNRESVRSRLGITSKTPVIGIVARLAPEKDHASLLKAFPLVLAQHPSALLMIVGDGPLRRDMEACASDLGISGNVCFIGARSDVPDLLGIMDVFVLSSLTEGTSLTIIEAMAAGLPVIATDVGGSGALVRDGEMGLLVPPGSPHALTQAMISLLSNPERARSMGYAGKQRAKSHFSRETMARQYEALYESLLSAKTGKSIR